MYHNDETLLGALAVNGQSVVMKLRAMIAKGRTRSEAVEFVDKKRVV